MIVFPAGRIFEALFSTPACVTVLSVSRTKTSLRLGASFAVYRGTSPLQYSVTDVSGVPPPGSSLTSSRTPTSQPSGISPSSDDTSRSGKRSVMSLSIIIEISAGAFDGPITPHLRGSRSRSRCRQLGRFDLKDHPRSTQRGAIRPCPAPWNAPKRRTSWRAFGKIWTCGKHPTMRTIR